MEQANLLKPSNAEINNIDKQFIKIRLETDVIIKSLAIFTIYNWQSADVMNSLAFPTALYMQNNIRYVNNNGKFFALHYHLIQSNSDLDHIQSNISLINIIYNETTTLQQTITKAFISITPDVDAKIRDNVVSTQNSI